MSPDEKTPLVSWDDLRTGRYHREVPGLLVTFHPRDVWMPTKVIEVPAEGEGLEIGRSPEAAWTVADRRLSKSHLVLSADGEEGSLEVRDLGSTNGTFIHGERLLPQHTHVARDGDVLAFGRLVMVFHRDVSKFSSGRPSEMPNEMAGSFHSPRIFQSCQEGAATRLPILLSGDSGTGKEHAASAVASLYGSGSGKDYLAVNAARFTNEEEATTSLFGVEAGVFSGVEARKGLLEEAEGGTLFIDEVHELSARAQRALLRFVEDGVFSRVGSRQRRGLVLKLILGTNLDVEEAVRNHRLAFDMVNRLWRLHLPTARERRADLPEIFLHHLDAAMEKVFGEDALKMGGAHGAVSARQMEAICLMELKKKNLRELAQLAEITLTRTVQRELSPKEALSSLLLENYEDNPVVQRMAAEAPRKKAAAKNAKKVSGGVIPPRKIGWGRSRYERNRELIVRVFHGQGENVSATVRELKKRGVKVSRRWLTTYLERWGEK